MQEDKTERIDGPTKIAAANDNNPEQRCVLAIARLLGRRIAREEFEKRIAAANDNAPLESERTIDREPALQHDCIAACGPDVRLESRNNGGSDEYRSRGDSHP